MWPAWSGWQYGGAIARRHLGIRSIDLRFIEAGSDDGNLGVVGNDEARYPSNSCKGARVGADPIAERLRPGGLHVSEARCAHDGDKDFRLAHLAGRPVDDHRHRVACVINEQLIATQVGLAHRHRKLGFPAAVEFAKAGVVDRCYPR